MLAEIYTVKLCESAMDLVHGIFSVITEIYLPSKKIAFNETNDQFHCFVSDGSRYNNCQQATKIGEIEIPKAMVQAMTDYIAVSKRLGKTKKWFKRCVIARTKSGIKARKLRSKKSYNKKGEMR